MSNVLRFSFINRKSLYISLIIMLASIIFISSQLEALNSSAMQVKAYLRSDGLLIVKLTGNVVEGLNEVHLPIKPVPVTIEVYINETLTPTIYINGTVYIPSRGVGTLLVKYIANITAVNSAYFFEVVTDDIIELIVEPKVILLSMPSNIIKVETVNNNLILIFMGPTVIQYTLSATSSSSSGSVEKNPQTSINLTSNPIVWVGISVIFFLIIISIFKLKFKRKNEITIITSELDSTDKEILQKLNQLGGVSFQSQLQRKLGLPKATLWRHVNKLAKLGYLEIIREGKRNKLILKKKI